MKQKTILLLLFSFILCSCSFNSMFLHPAPMPANTSLVKQAAKNDTSYIYFEGDLHQPTFTNKSNKPVNLDFTVESFVFKSSNGHKLNGWLLKPKNVSPSYTLLHFHGNAGYLVSQYRAISPLINHGFQVFLFDYSGFGFSEGKATRKNVLKDANAALTYVKSRQETTGTKLLIYGQSLGGHLAAVVGAERQEEIDGLVIEGAFSSHKDVAATRAGFLAHIFVKELYSGKKSIKQYKKPLLVIHSSEDHVVPFKLGKKLFDAASTAKDFYEVQKCHICAPFYYHEEIAARIRNMFPE